MNDPDKNRSRLTPAKLALLEERLRRGREKASAQSAIHPASGSGPWPLSFAQERLWFLDRLYGENPIYNEPSAARLRGDLDAAALQQSLSALVERHEVLRSTYSSDDSEPRQRVQSPIQIPLPVIDLRDLPGDGAETAWRQQATAAAKEPFDLQNDSMLRAALYRLASDDYRLLLVKHHIAHDGWSTGIIMRELSALYEAALRRESDTLSPLPLQYKDYAVWQRSDEQRPRFNKSLDYWREQLAALPPLELPTDHPHPPQIDTSGTTITFQIPAEIAGAVDKLARSENSTRYMVLLSAFFVLLHRYSTQEDFAVGSPVANRQEVELEQLIGFFVNMLVIRADLSGEPSFRELLDRTRGVVLEALQHQDLPFAQLIAALQPERQMSRNPLFQVAFQVINRTRPALKLPGITAESVKLDFGIAKFDLDVSVNTSGSDWVGRWRYASAIFDRQTAERMVSHYLRLLEAIVADPDQAIGRLPLLTTAERQQLLYDWNDTAVHYPRQSSIHELFAEQARLSADKTAVISDETSLSYGELDRLANRLARCLVQRGLKPGDAAGLALKRSPDLIVAMLAILKTGAAYLPLDSDYPPERIAGMLEDAHCRVVVTSSDQVQSLPGKGFDLVRLDKPEVLAALAGQDDSEACSDPPPGSALDTAYIIYTSGSTGRPKGVVIPHRAVVRLVKNTNYAELGSEQRFIQIAPVSFDAATLEIWGPLLNGGRLFIPPPGPISLADLAAYLRQQKISYLFLTSGLFTQMVEHEVEALSAVAQVQTGGDVVSPAHVRRLLLAGGICQFSVVYGPTENTTYSTYSPLKSVDEIGERLSIGRPISSSTAIILDKNLQPVPAGVAGELTLGGDGLAVGYLNDAKLTAERFIADPFSEEEGARLYRTGDLARFLPDGRIDFLGRIDQQVKIRGYRIEPGEIESWLGKHEAVAQSVVVPHGSDSATKQLVAYIVPAAGQAPDTADLKGYLAAHLPAYMIPSLFMSLDQLPLDPNGKIDRRTLPEPTLTAVAAGEHFKPRSANEIALADIWGELLGLEIVDIHTSFFDAGGHSLLGVRLFALIEERLGKRLPLSLLFEAPTVAGLAQALEEGGSSDEDHTLLAIKPSGTLPPFFAAHGVFGDMLAFTNFQAHLDVDQPFYGFQAEGLLPGHEPDPSIEAMATRYIEAMRRVQPGGPYNLGGFCFGGLIAYEMACQLEAAGESVALLALMEASAPREYRQGVPLTHPRRLESIRQSFPYWLNGNNELGGWRITLRLQRLLGLADKTKFQRNDGIVPDEDYDNFADHITWRPPIQRQLRDLNTTIAHDFTPKPYGGRLTLIRAQAVRQGTLLFKPFDPYRGWGELAQGGIDIRYVSGSHGTIIREHNAADLARVVMDALRDANA